METVQAIMRNKLDHVHYHAKLEAIDFTPCTRLHQDKVNLRVLCTYCGPGTLYIPDEQVIRFPKFLHAVKRCNFTESDVVQVQPGDLLFLKGEGLLGRAGCGAIHRSPDMQENDVRLLLTISDVCQ
eukprot:TRINITY_DN18690_c4_g1_i1.p2 TRINITY_DN18690_c4_g1~~TRINITY_DN18690_c4_g1_i1.p2  ORF type:complete len:126 (-),score=13.29 TRINITY_DN18690_c4_g1_i1:296-673(-)